MIEYYSWINNFCFEKSTSLAFCQAYPANQGYQSVLTLFPLVIGILPTKLKRLMIRLISVCDLYRYIFIIFDIIYLKLFQASDTDHVLMPRKWACVVTKCRCFCFPE